MFPCWSLLSSKFVSFIYCSCDCLIRIIQFVINVSHGAFGVVSDLLGSLAMMDREEACTICYACEVDTIFLPCKHKSCQRCISRHLLNNQRCFFCNSTVVNLSSMVATPGVDDEQCPGDESRSLAEALMDGKMPQPSRGSPPRIHQQR